MPLRQHLPRLSAFVELTERRNAIAHGGAVASPYYVAQCSKHGVAPGALEGQALAVDKGYFGRCLHCVFETGVELSQLTWRKVCPAEIAGADYVLREITYALLVREQFELARNLLSFAYGLEVHSSEHVKRIFAVNLAQSHKWLGEDDVCKQIVEDVDWTAAEPAFILAQHVLLEDFDQAGDYMLMTGRANLVPEEAFRDWPLFRVFRHSEQFGRAFREIYGRPFATA